MSNPQSSVNRKQSALLTVGVFLERMSTQYHQAIWSGIVEVAQSLKIHLLTFIIGNVSAETNPQNALYEFIDEEVLDGVILIKSPELEAMVTQTPPPPWMSRVRNLPAIRLGMPSADIPSIEINNHIGSRQLMEHIIVDHGCRQIAFITGLPDHPDAYVRYEAYLKALQAHHLPLVPELVVEGSFTRPSGYRAMQQLLQTFAGDLDAVFAANDEMALGAIQALAEHGYDVPNDVVVVGFDDVPEGEFVSTPLTTVHQPLFEMGQRATQMVYDLIQGRDCQFAVELPANVIIRQSCGCLPEAVTQAGLDTAVLVQSASPHKLSDEWLLKLEELLVADIQNKTSNEFLPNLSNLTRQSSANGLGSAQWQNLITFLRSRIQPALANSQQRKKAESLLHQARVLLADTSFRAQAANSTAIARQTSEISGIIQHISHSFDFGQFYQALMRQLPRVGINKAVLTIHDVAPDLDDANQYLPTLTRRVLHFDKSGESTTNPHVIKTLYLAKEGIFSAQQPEIGIVQALFQRSRPIGLLFLGVPPDKEDLYIYRLLQSQISNTLRGGQLVRQIQEHAADLEDEVARRTDNLQRANLQLKQYADELERSNRELKVVAYVASHDLQEPLRKIQVFADRLSVIAQGSLSERGLDYLMRMQNAASRMQSLIQDLLVFSRVTTRDLTIEDVNLARIVQSVLTELRPVINQISAEVVVDELPIVEADKYQIILLFRNLVSNGLKFQRPEIRPILQIKAEMINERRKLVRLFFKDNGIGFDIKYEERVFNAFQQLHGRDEYEGSGIGLAVCRRIVERHHGRIGVKSQPGQGSTFIVELPLKHPGD